MSGEYDNSIGSFTGSFKSYLIGFLCSIIVTITAFSFVTLSNYSRLTSCLIISILAVIQLVIQIVCFLHLNMDKRNLWSFITVSFTILILLIIVFGTIWIMFDLYSMLLVV